MRQKFDEEIENYKKRLLSIQENHAIQIAIMIIEELKKANRYYKEITGVKFAMGSWYFWDGKKSLPNDDYYKDKKSCKLLFGLCNYLGENVGIYCPFNEISLAGVVFEFSYRPDTRKYYEQGELIIEQIPHKRTEKAIEDFYDTHLFKKLKSEFVGVKIKLV